MNRIAYSRRDIALRQFRHRYVPLISTILAIFISALPIVVTSPVLPDFAFLALISWRLLRPEMWSAHVALPLGLLNDLVDGHPLGQSMALWTMAFLAFDILDSRIHWRDYWMDWLFAAIAIVFYTLGAWTIERILGSATGISVILPQLALSIFLYPFVARIILALDRWRLTR